MRNFVINSLEIVLWAVLAAFAIIGTIIMPVIGTLIGLILGAALTGFGFVLLSINSHLGNISRELEVQRTGASVVQDRSTAPLTSDEA